MNSIYIHPSVLDAIQRKQPVVALESTIISHGMPYPDNVITAKACEDAIRQNGAFPATIAILDGVITVGLTATEIEKIATKETEVLKVSRRDLPYAISQKKNGALTVAATMIACKLAGIQFFATGGIGGVHRGAEVSMDISADLMELKDTSVCVVSAGVKSILDIEKTLEVLETFGVPVIGYQSDTMPAFYTRTSPYPIEMRLDTPEEIAAFVKAKWNLDLVGGVLVANPVPEEVSYDSQEIETAIAKALEEMNAQGIVGKAQTPFLLGKIVEITGGKSLVTNQALVVANAGLAAKIAVSYFGGTYHEAQ